MLLDLLLGLENVTTPGTFVVQPDLLLLVLTHVRLKVRVAEGLATLGASQGEARGGWIQGDGDERPPASCKFGHTGLRSPPSRRLHGAVTLLVVDPEGVQVAEGHPAPAAAELLALGVVAPQVLPQRLGALLQHRGLEALGTDGAGVEVGQLVPVLHRHVSLQGGEGPEGAGLA